MTETANEVRGSYCVSWGSKEVDANSWICMFTTVGCAQTKINSLAWVCELIGEVSANVWGYRLPRGQRDGSLRPYSRFSRPEPLLFLSSSPSIVLTRLSGPRSRPNTPQKSNPHLWICSAELWPLDHRGGRIVATKRKYRKEFLTELY
jgi:hypothetical protein